MNALPFRFLPFAGVVVTWFASPSLTAFSAAVHAPLPGIPDSRASQAVAVPLPTRDLFPGDLSQWESYLGVPDPQIEVPGLPRGADGKYLRAVGANVDPKKVFSVTMRDGEAAIRISGELFGALTSREAFENYHLELEFAWGEEKWPPRKDKKRDSGLLYHADGPPDAAFGYWMRSLEFQIQEGDCGDLYALAGAWGDVPGLRDGPSPRWRFSPGFPRTVVGMGLADRGGSFRAVKSTTNERPHGHWNRLELYVVGNRAVHVVNGVPVMALENARVRRTDGSEVPLTRGRLQLQTEGAEVFYRRIRLHPLARMPIELEASFAPAADPSKVATPAATPR